MITSFYKNRGFGIVGWRFIAERLLPRQLLPTDGQGRAGRLGLRFHGDRAFSTLRDGDRALSQKTPVAGYCQPLRHVDTKPKKHEESTQSGAEVLGCLCENLSFFFFFFRSWSHSNFLECGKSLAEKSPRPGRSRVTSIHRNTRQLLSFEGYKVPV